MASVDELKTALTDFARDTPIKGKGALAVAVQVTDQAKQDGLPLDPEDLLVPRKGGGRFSGPRLKAILARHGISRILVVEGARTSRGSIDNMRAYIALLNQLHERGIANLDVIETFWVARVIDFFNAQPLRVGRDPQKSLTQLVRDLLEAARARQQGADGMQYVGAVLQHVVGAKLETVAPDADLPRYAFSTADAQLGRAADFELSDVAIHVTTSPSEALAQKCLANIEAGLRPVIVTTSGRASIAAAHADDLDILPRVDIFEVEQFVALNLYEWAGFTAEGRKTALDDFVARYNEIIDEAETDPSLKIKLG